MSWFDDNAPDTKPKMALDGSLQAIQGPPADTAQGFTGGGGFNEATGQHTTLGDFAPVGADPRAPQPNESEQQFISRLWRGGMNPQQVIDLANGIYHDPYGSQPAYDARTNTIGLPGGYIEGNQYGFVPRGPEGPSSSSSTAPGGFSVDPGLLDRYLEPFTGQFTAPTDLTEQNDPGFKARLKLGTDAIQSSAAAQGTLLTGGTAKALERYGQDYASNEYGNVYNRALGEFQQGYDIFQNNQNAPFQKLATLSSLGLNAAEAQNAAANVFGGQLGSLAGLGTSLSSSYLGTLGQNAGLSTSLAGDSVNLATGFGNSGSNLLTQIGNSIGAGQAGSGSFYANIPGSLGNFLQTWQQQNGYGTVPPPGSGGGGY